ncbi:hepatitis A virus cellular receptor 1-like [Tachysurus ichikawai]
MSGTEGSVTSLYCGNDDSSSEEDDDDGNKHDKKDRNLNQQNWNTAYTAAIVGLSCVVVLLLVLLMWRFFTKRIGIGVTQNQPHIYTYITDFPEASRQGEQQRESEAVYFLAQNPASNTTGTES